MNLAKVIPDEVLREALFLSIEDDDLERRLCRLEEMIRELKDHDEEEDV
ncbi:MAG: hypothetical protein ACLGHN_06275 [Bacteriovoracia bacterium]